MAKLNFTLLFYLALVLAIIGSANANTLGSHHRDHGDLGRLVKKRAAASTPSNQSSAQGEQTPSSSAAVQTTQTSSAVVQTTPTDSASVQTTAEAASTATSGNPSTVGLSGSVTSALQSAESSAASSAASATTPSTSNAAATTPQTSAQANQASAATAAQSILYLTTSGAPTPTQTNADSTSSGISHAAVTVLIVIAASVGASVIVWTVIRKWKFRPSTDFDSRMQPIDWHPDGNNEDTDHRPLSRASSFHSGPNHGVTDDEMRGMGGYGTTVLNPIPDHDFTAGPVNLAPVGGYADLARGPSPQPMMQEPLGRSLTINRPVQHDQFGVPLHHGYGGY